MLVYLATLVATSFFMRPYPQWAALLSVAVATCVAIIVWDRRSFSIGFFVRPGVASREFIAGAGVAAVLILACNGLVILFSNLRQSWAGGFPFGDLLAVFIPAALHEELAFRGYLYQKMRIWNRGAAIAISSLVFAWLHWGNDGASALALINILIAGVLLALAFERHGRLWFPIGVHFVWNVLSGPVLGFPVSGFVARQTVFRVSGAGGALVTGGAFGIEGSICMTVMEVLAIACLGISNFEFRRKNSETS